MRRAIETITGVVLGVTLALVIAFVGDHIAQAQTPPHYRAEFAPITELGSNTLHAVNPALVVDMWETKTQSGVVTVIVLAGGDHIRTRGTIREVAAVLRVAVWLEDIEQGADR